MSSKREGRRRGGGNWASNSRRGADASAFGASIDVVDFAVARATELRALRLAASTINGNRRVYQQLSWHARRRTMSHSSRRMPVRLRAAHAAQLQKQRPPGQPEKPPGPRGAARLRKYRKKARFLDSMRKLRSKNPAWLETHVWHAKRFSMGSLGEKKIALRCNDRGYRSCYRATAHASVAHDASYLALVEVCASSREELKGMLKRRMNFEDGRRATTDPVTSGTRRVTDLMLQDESGAPIAPVDMLWRPGTCAQIWAWVLPPSKELVQRTFEKRFSDESDNVRTVSEVTSPPISFSLFGPRSGIVLASVLDPPANCPDGLKFITQVRSAACLPVSCVYSGETVDPRKRFPPKTMGKHNQNVKVFDDEIRDVFRRVEDSELWSEERRKYWKEYIINGAAEQSKSKAASVPFMLLQRNHEENRGFASGWELIIPAGWGMTFWASIMFSNGNRAIGQDELRLLRLEANLPIFPEDFGDTSTGRAALRDIEADLMAAHLRRPKSKRVNYMLNRIDSPMYPALSKVAKKEERRTRRAESYAPPLKKPRSGSIEDGEGAVSIDENRVRIIRGAEELRTSLGGAYDSISSMPGGQVSRRPRSSPASDVQPKRADKGLLATTCNLFTRVALRVPGKGVPTKNAIICEATASDMTAMQRTNASSYGGFREKKAKRNDSATSREVIGYVTLGTFSLTNGGAVANGIVSVNAIRRLVERGAIVSPHRTKGKKTSGIAVLFRNVSSLQYRPALLTVIP